MLLRIPLIICLSFFLWVGSYGITPPAFASIPIDLFDLSYGDCPPEFAEGNMSSDGTSVNANCYMITGKAENKSGKMVVDADIFGRVYDADHNPIMEHRSRLGSIESVPPGISDFSIRITVPNNQPTPLSLEQFKASGFTAKVRW